MAANEHGITYQHTPLPPDTRCFRVLKVHPIAENDAHESLLQGSLVVCDSEQKPEYAALSYVWGLKDANSPAISIDGQYLTITENCHQALLNIRQLLGGFTIWVDAICIDQHNESEQGQQIAQMTDIYAGAAKVYIWLGQGSESTDRAMACLKAVAFPESLCSKAPRWHLLTRYRDHWRKNFAMMQLEPPAMYIAIIEAIRQRSFHALFGKQPRAEFLKTHRFQLQNRVQYAEIEELLSAEWLDRIWTYQEIMLSTSPIILRGQNQLEWNKFSFGVLTIESILQESDKKRQMLLDKWTRLMVDREQFQNMLLKTYAQVPPGDSDHNIISRYRDLLRSFRRRQVALWLYVSVLLLSVFLLITLPPALTTTTFSFEVALAIGIPYGVVMALWGGGFLAAFNPFSRHIHRQQDRMPGLVYAVLTRRATVRKDYNRGIRSVLEILTGQRLPIFNFSCSETEAYHDLTVRALQATNFGDILVSAAIQHVDGLPSWIPAWSEQWKQPFNVLSYIGNNSIWHDGESSSHDGNIKSWHPKGATRGSTLQFHYDPARPDILCIRGVEIAKINRVFSCYCCITIKEKIILLDGLLSKMIRRSGQRAKIWHNGGFDSKFYWGLYGLKRSLEKYVESVERDTENQHEKPPETSQLDDFEDTRGRSYFDNWWRYFHAAVPGKPQEVWDTGIAMDRIEVGDRIFLLSGVSAPLVLRPRYEGGYVLISPVRLLDRAMTGKYWQEKEGHEYPYIELH